MAWGCWTVRDDGYLEWWMLPAFGVSATCTHLALEEAVGERKGVVSATTRKQLGSLASYASVSLKMIERDEFVLSKRHFV